jgi:hypothetical protein
MNKAIASVKRQLLYKPFRPFSVITVAGMRISIGKAEWFYEVPNGPLIISDPAGVTVTWWEDLSETIDIVGPIKNIGTDES